MIYNEKNVDLTDKKIFDDHGDEICKVCPWNKKESHHLESICEANHCGEAIELFREKEMNFMQNKVKEIKGRVERATPGPWEIKDNNINGEKICILIRLEKSDEFYVCLDCCDVINPTSGVLTVEDGVLISHAREDILYLLEALQQAQDKLNLTEDEWELKVSKRLTYCENEPNKSIMKINQELKIELQQSLARERVYRETLKNFYNN